MVRMLMEMVKWTTTTKQKKKNENKSEFIFDSFLFYQFFSFSIQSSSDFRLTESCIQKVFSGAFWALKLKMKTNAMEQKYMKRKTFVIIMGPCGCSFNLFHKKKFL